MKKILTLNRDQARTLYNLLSSHSVPSRSDNRKRFKFMEVIEDFVFEFEDKIDEITKTKGMVEEKNKKLRKLGKQNRKFTFKDRELFSKVEKMFEATFEAGTINTDQAGKTTRSPLIGRNARLYTELEDAFADVVTVKDAKKKK